MSVTQERFAKMRPARGRGPKVTADQLPRGPRMPALLQSIGLLGFRHRFVPAMKRRYGDVFSLELLPEGRWLVLFHRPDAVKEIFAGDPEVFHAGKGNSILGPVMGEHSLLLVDGAAHKRARKLLMPAFNGHALRGYQEVVTGLAKTEVAGWQPGVEFRSLERMNALTLEVILQVVFGVTDEARLAKLRPLVNNVVNIHPLVFLGWGFPRLQQVGPWRRTFENQERLDRLIYAEIAERRTAPDLADRTDVLSRLLHVRDDDGEGGLTDDELRDQLVTLLLAGHETTATALAWTVDLLLRHPHALARLSDDVTSGSESYLRAVISESLRLRPVVPLAGRRLATELRTESLQLPAGTDVTPAIWLTHTRADLYPEPYAFRPERFLERPPTTYGWIPFGGGVRRCLGAAFAELEMRVVLKAIVEGRALRAASPRAERVTRRNVTFSPRNGTRVVISSRSV